MKLLIVAFLLFTINTGYSQHYTFTQTSEPFNIITGGTVISIPGWDYLDVDTVPFPFQFSYFGADFDTFYLAGGFGGFIYGSSYFGDYKLFFYDAPLMDIGFGSSPVSYIVSGNTPDRIVKVQIDNAGFIDDQTFNDYVDVQLWFYETTNVIEIHNGPNSVANNNSWYPGYNGPTIALLRDTSTFIHLHGPASNASSSTTYVADFVTGPPPANSVYRFTPLINNIDTPEDFQFSFYPNPSNGELTVSGLYDAVIEIYDLTGRKLWNEKSAFPVTTLSLNLTQGTYILKVTGNGKQSARRLIIN